VLKYSKFTIFSIIVLVYNVFVILWGAYVRATGSGAGCGSHWPLCNGEVIPRSPQLETLVEFTHRLSSGLAFILVAILFIWAFRIFKKGNPTRLGAALSLLFIILEALVGAGLVLFEWVAYDASTGRVISIAVHLVNTLLLLAALSLTIWWSLTGKKIHLNFDIVFWSYLVAFLAMILLGVSGAITALGDTLFPSQTLSEGIQQDFMAASHVTIRLRVWHPIIAILTGSYLFLLSLLTGLFYTRKTIRTFSALVIGLFFLQLGAGLVNLLLLAPVWMQLVHLLLADLVWISLVFLSVEAISYNPVSQQTDEIPVNHLPSTKHVGERT
jgi:heme A synthase